MVHALTCGVHFAVAGFGEDVDLPAQKFGGQLDVLPFAANGQGELIVGTDHFQCFLFIVHGDAGDDGWRQCVLSVHGDVRTPDNDVDAFSLEFLHHILNTGATDTDAGADRINVTVA